MSSDSSRELPRALRQWWRDTSADMGRHRAAALLVRELWDFLRDSTPQRRRSRYGDMDYDWEHHVNTTSGTVGWRERLLGIFHSPYMPTDPATFREMMESLGIAMESDFREFTFIDIGSGKGRTLLMASEYAFQRILGVEVIPQLHHSAESNIAAFRARSSAHPAAGIELATANSATTESPTTPLPAIESLCMDAREFVFPQTPLVVYLFNPLPEAGLRDVVAHLDESSRNPPRPVWIAYHNPLLENLLAEFPRLEKVREKTEFSLFRIRPDTTT